jgi:hypothetical protein
MEDILLEVARQKLRAGDLPCDHDKTWGGSGTGYPCSLCGEAITPQGIEYEVEHVDVARSAEVCDQAARRSSSFACLVNRADSRIAASNIAVVRFRRSMKALNSGSDEATPRARP